MKRYTGILIFLLACLVLPVKGQQTPLYTQYMFNQLLYNPAIAGVDPYYQIRSNHRFQWAGMTDAPLTNALAFHGPHPTLPMGYGGYIYHDVTGPTSQTSITGTYAYNIRVAENTRLSLGLSVGVMQYRVDGTQITIKDPTDQALQQAVYTSWVPDANLGLYLYHEDFYVGFSTAHMISTQLKLYEPGIGINKLKTHFFLTGGYIWEINQDFKLEPSFMLKGSLPNAVQFDINARVIWQDMVWGGISYRTSDAVSILIGYSYEEKIYFGYSYDITLSDLRNYNTGTHEIMIGFRFNDVK
jgi:type IX secretion system PorP/SprF family membrane protein